MARVLYVATSDLHIKTFHVPYLNWLKSEGHTVELAVENRGNFTFESCDKYHYLKFPRVACSLQHPQTFRALSKVILDGNYQLVHCHTPIPSALCRLSGRKWRKQGGKLLYTAHGFHFYRGCSLWKWCTYYPIERFLSRFTDGIITINREDYQHAKSFGSKSRVYLIPGIGIGKKFSKKVDEGAESIKESLGLESDSFVVTYIAEFIARKNHSFIVKAAGRLLTRIPRLRILFVGEGVLFGHIKEMIRKNCLESTIRCLGFREDIQRIAKITDLAVSASLHEGLGLGLAEQMMCAVPVVASQDKGHAELVDHGKNGFLFPQGDESGFVEGVVAIYSDPEMRARMSCEARIKSKKFSIENSLSAMIEIYREYL